jgi:hypothetical protein
MTKKADQECGCEAPCRTRNFRAFATTHIRRAELVPSATALTRANDQAIRRALEQAGIEFIDAEGGGGPGVRLRTPQRIINFPMPCAVPADARGWGELLNAENGASDLQLRTTPEARLAEKAPAALLDSA